MKRKKYDVEMRKRIQGKEEGGRWLEDAPPNTSPDKAAQRVK